MEDAYRNIGRLYLALLSPEQVKGERLGDDAMNRWMLGVPPGASVLDACCGIGNDVLALHRGIPMAGKGGPWTVYGSDLSESLLEVAQTRTSAHGLPADRFRCSSFADLNRITDWRQRFDIVLAAHAIYTAPEGIERKFLRRLSFSFPARHEGRFEGRWVLADKYTRLGGSSRVRISVDPSLKTGMTVKPFDAVTNGNLETRRILHMPPRWLSNAKVHTLVRPLPSASSAAVSRI